MHIHQKIIFTVTYAWKSIARDNQVRVETRSVYVESVRNVINTGAQQRWFDMVWRHQGPRIREIGEFRIRETGAT